MALTLFVQEENMTYIYIYIVGRLEEICRVSRISILSHRCSSGPNKKQPNGNANPRQVPEPMPWDKCIENDVDINITHVCILHVFYVCNLIYVYTQIYIYILCENKCIYKDSFQAATFLTLQDRIFQKLNKRFGMENFPWKHQFLFYPNTDLHP